MGLFGSFNVLFTTIVIFIVVSGGLAKNSDHYADKCKSD